MARYIDADRLSRQILDSWDNDNHRTIQASQVHRQEHQHLMRMIEKQPTADVVPKSEYEQLKAMYEDNETQRAYTINMLGEHLETAKTEVERLEHLRAELSIEVADLQDAIKCEKETNAHLCGEYISAKADVAREIFEEIEEDVLDFPMQDYDIHIILDKGRYDELKKKYIGGD